MAPIDLDLDLMGSLMTLVGPRVKLPIGNPVLSVPHASIQKTRHERTVMKQKTGVLNQCTESVLGRGKFVCSIFFLIGNLRKKSSTNIFFRAHKFSPTNLFIRKNMASFWMGDLLLTITGTIFVRRVPVA